MTPQTAAPITAWGIDAESSSAVHVPKHVPVFWPYITGTPDVIWSPTQIATVDAGLVITVDQGYDRINPLLPDEFDVEAHAITTQQAAAIALARADARKITRFYGTWATMADVSEELAFQELLRNVWWRISDWNLDEEMAKSALVNNVYAVQWASPTSNPHTLIPGTNTTLAAGNADLSVAIVTNIAWRD